MEINLEEIRILSAYQDQSKIEKEKEKVKNIMTDILSKLKHWRFLGFYCSLTRLAIQFPIRLRSLAICGDLFLAANDHTYTNAILKLALTSA